MKLDTESDKGGNCFTNRKIMMNDGQMKYLRSIKSGDRISRDILITGKLETNINAEMDIYKYRGVEVTGDHMVLHNGNWKRIKDICLSNGDNSDNSDNGDNTCIKIRKYVDKLYCLLTDNNMIEIDGITFRDYMETSDPLLLAYMNYYVKRDVNGNTGNTGKVSENINHTYIQCFDKSVYDKIIKSNCKITGRVEILNTENIKLYNYDGNILSGNVLILDGETGKWKRVWELDKAIAVRSADKYLYHVMTEDNIITLEGENSYKIRDYSESNNTELNKKVDEMIINNLNE